MILHENRLPADDSHKISCLFDYFRKNGKILNYCLLQIIGGALRVKKSNIIEKNQNKLTAENCAAFEGNLEKYNPLPNSPKLKSEKCNNRY